MKNIMIPVFIPPDVMIALNETEQELKSHFQASIALMLFQEGKLSIGKAIQLSGMTRYEFEKALVKNKISVSDLSFEQIRSDVDKLNKL